AFVGGIFVVVFIKYNSDKGNTKLIEDNERLLNEFKVNNRLDQLKTDVVLVENKIKGAVATNDSSYLKGVETLMAKIEADLEKLQTIRSDDSTERYIDQLDFLVRENLKVSNQVLDNFI